MAGGSKERVGSRDVNAKESSLENAQLSRNGDGGLGEGSVD